MWSANVSEAREKTKQLIDGWKEDAKGVLLFSGLFSAIVAAFLMESYKKLCEGFGGPGGPGTGTQSQAPPPPATSIIVVNIAWLLSLVLNIVSALCATLTLQWARRYTRLPNTSSDHVPVRPRHMIRSMRYGIAMTVTLLQPSVFLFLMGLVMFFFTINKTVAIVVAITVGVFGGVCLALTSLACLDRNRRRYRTPFCCL
ncbi:hypothetical protein BC827DRAFT_175353 [Russula dissimulans]|nr:hypothetical protein BC827DRAFT_175353 [Russula dissimulans]